MRRCRLMRRDVRSVVMLFDLDHIHGDFGSHLEL